MTRPVSRLRCFLVLLALACPTVVLAQPPVPPAPDGLHDSGAQPWVVIKVSLDDFAGQEDAIVADCATQEQARDCAARLNKAEKAPTKTLYAYQQRQPEAGTVAGKTYQGKIGQSSIVVTFADGGAFTISGEMQGQGKWMQAGDGVLLETATARYRGYAAGDKLSGLRFLKDGSEPVASWTLAVQTVPSAGLVGRWVEERRTVDSWTGVTLILRPDGTGTWLHDFDYMAAHGGMVRSRVQQLEVRWRPEKGPEAGDTRDGILLEHASGDRPWLSHWIERGPDGLAGPWKRAG